MESAEPQASVGAVDQLVQHDRASLRAALDRLNGCDVAVLQHEYGIYGGPDGNEILDLLAGLRVPSIVVLHTVLTAPTRPQREILETIARLADAVVTMTSVAHQRLANLYDVDMDKVRVIGHGAPDQDGGPVAAHTGAPTILTWGLIGPGKGIEWGIEAMALLGDLRPRPRYVVAGQTHPKVLQHEGEAYRNRLQNQIARRGLQNCVRLDPTYRDAPALAELVRSADVVLLPYDSTDQVTSGVLIEAVAAGKPVVATRFPHAVELLSSGAGALVPHRDPSAIADALRRIVTDSGVAATMSAVAATTGALEWSAIAQEYRDLAHHLIRAGVAA
jgi:glycosyltransferase involved in cell wall biosynthesis